MKTLLLLCALAVALTGCDRTTVQASNGYSVDAATHQKQMSDCKADIQRFRHKLQANKLQRDDHAALDAHDAALLKANICITYATEPLPSEDKEVIGDAIRLNMDIAEQFRYNK